MIKIYCERCNKEIKENESEYVTDDYYYCNECGEYLDAQANLVEWGYNEKGESVIID